MTVHAPLSDVAGQAATLLAESAIILSFDAKTGKALAASEEAAKVLGDGGLERCSFETVFLGANAAWQRALDGEAVTVSGALPQGAGAFQACAGIVRMGEGRNPPVIFVGVPVCAQSGEDSIGLLIHRFEALGKALAICQYEPDGTVAAANDAYLALTGRQREALLQSPFTSLFAPGSMPEDPLRWWSSFSRGQSETLLRRHVDSDGMAHWLREVFVPTMEDKRLVSVLCYAIDVTATHEHAAEQAGQITAINRSHAMIEFDLQGNVLTANDNFLKAIGWTLAEIKGRHHRMFCDPDMVAAADYAMFWERLALGEYVSGEFKRVRKDGEALWIQASYNPIFDADGKPVKVCKIAADITAEKLKSNEYEAKVAAMGRALAVVEFDLNGNVLTANDNFLSTMGYSLREIMSQHHAMFCSPDFVRTRDYAEFWLKLNRGEFHSGRFHRVGKYDRDVWIQATYNPILDLRGIPVRIVKFAFDITDQVKMEREIEARASDLSSLVERLSSSIASIGDATLTAGNLADQTRENAQAGMGALAKAIEAIELIQTSASGIAETVGIIGEIAGQTNLLAFNAEIEAARAGEHGVGFSVVAGEVRRLAERSSTAARDISRLIQESLSRIGMGTARSHEASSAFDGIVDSVHSTGTAIEAISASATSQELVSAEVVTLITRLASVAGDARKQEMA